jgi:hypothetical protein
MNFGCSRYRLSRDFERDVKPVKGGTRNLLLMGVLSASFSFFYQLIKVFGFTEYLLFFINKGRS